MRGRRDLVDERPIPVTPTDALARFLREVEVK
jgi:hypothetical protein